MIGRLTPGDSFATQIRRGNMELQKAQNMLEHEDEIKSRPARTWFQSTSEKNAAKSRPMLPSTSVFGARTDAVPHSQTSERRSTTPSSPRRRRSVRATRTRSRHPSLCVVVPYLSL